MTPAQPTALVEVADARARVIIALRQIERDVRVTDLTDAEIDSIVEAANAGVRLAALEEAARGADVYSSIHVEKRDDLLATGNATGALTMARQAQTCDELATAIRKAKDTSHE